MNEIKSPKGTRDILPGEVEAWQRVEKTARRLFGLYGFEEMRTPVLEPTELFRKSTGADTDIVMKEMYTFEDRAGRSLTLRPEGTPGVVRAALEHGLLGRSDIRRFYYIGPMFRYERPQKGRYRQFGQIGVEVFGSPDPSIDAEVIQMANALFRELGLSRTRLLLNSVGHRECRGAYRDALREALRPHADSLCADCRRRLDENPLRILDCKVPSDAEYRAKAPVILDYLCGDCRAHFERVRKLLETLEVPHEIDPRLVRGLDYYTRTTFEITSERLGAQNAICGGGRYDDLVGSMGGPPTPAFGFAIGTDRLVIEVLEESKRRNEQWGEGPDIYIVHLDDDVLDEALITARALRRLGLAARFDPGARDLKKQLSRASSLGARYALILGEREVESGAYSLKRLSDGKQMSIPIGDWDAIANEVAGGS